MNEQFLNGRVILHGGDCLDVLATLADDSLDSCVTDPPYHLVSIVKRFAKENPDDVQRNFIARKTDNQGLSPYQRAAVGFMGKQWDGGAIAQSVDLWRQVYRVLKPGAHLLAFGGTRTYHRMACAIEDAGFEIRDCIQWLYGSGFPKSHDVSKGIDRAVGAEREVIGDYAVTREFAGRDYVGDESHATRVNITAPAPATDAARQWEGWGTALKPACEPMVLARKPLSEKTVAANVLRWGTGAINIDGCRIEGQAQPFGNGTARSSGIMGNSEQRGGWESKSNGRWPANVIHDGSDEVVKGFPESGPASSGGFGGSDPGMWAGKQQVERHDDDGGSAARFFYTAKADSDDRIGSKHPTVKPLDLMQYLVRLVTPKGGTVLDCFAGSGTTGEAAFREGMKAVLIEREAEYQADIHRRMALCLAGPDERTRESVKARLGDKPIDLGPLFRGVA